MKITTMPFLSLSIAACCVLSIVGEPDGYWLLPAAQAVVPQQQHVPEGPVAAPAPTDAVAQQVPRLSNVSPNTSNQGPSSLTVQVTGLEPQGSVLIAVFEDESGFPRRNKAARTCQTAVTGKNTQVRIEGLPPGAYALALFQDLNNDGILNKGAFGVPTEPYGFSNNVRGTFGPPSFQAASFTLARGGQQVDVTVK
jgi:uncharacterized protein (DUF2141 family)